MARNRSECFPVTLATKEAWHRSAVVSPDLGMKPDQLSLVHFNDVEWGVCLEYKSRRGDHVRISKSYPTLDEAQSDFDRDYRSYLFGTHFPDILGWNECIIAPKQK